MPRRSLQIMLAVIVISCVCYARAARNPYGRYFSEILGHINQEYLDSVDQQKLFDSAVGGMIRAGLDEHSGFTPRERAADFTQELDQQFAGVGIVLTIDPESKQLIVQTPIMGSPAHTAGIQAGDKLLAIDGHSTVGLTIVEARQLIKGTAGLEVRLEIEHPGGKKVELTVKRALIRIDSVLGDTRLADGKWDFMLPGHDRIAYIRVVTFGEHTVEELKDALRNVEQQRTRGLILDLREDPGGLLEAAVAVCDLFLERNAVIVSTRGRAGDTQRTLQASGSGPYRELPLVILVNRNSASASEIVAACLQDHHRAAIVGERSYGKGTVQNLISTEGGRSLLRLTVASFWRPSNKNIRRSKENEKTDDWGVKPDDGLEVKPTDEELEKWEQARRDRDIVRPPGDTEGPAKVDDPQLDRAVEYLEGELAKKSG